jgi:hypothetical protein
MKKGEVRDIELDQASKLLKDNFIVEEGPKAPVKAEKTLEEAAEAVEKVEKAKPSKGSKAKTKEA